jgi:hypothetical protein
MIFAFPISYSLVQLLAKTAILLEWVNIFAPHRVHKSFYWTSYTMIILNAILFFSSIVATTAACIPHESIWSPWISGRCIEVRALWLSKAIFNTVLDLIILVFPQRMIWSLRMTTARKVGVSAVFSVGLLAIVCALGRLAAITKIDYTGDMSYTLSPVNIWAFAETTCVMLVFCLPALPKLFSTESAPFRLFQSVSSWITLSGSTLASKTGFASSKGSSKFSEGSVSSGSGT